MMIMTLSRKKNNNNNTNNVMGHLTNSVSDMLVRRRDEWATPFSKRTDVWPKIS